MLCQVLSGTGGVGKTQLAADYARVAWQTGEVDVLVWVSAISRPDIVAGYARACAEVLATDPSSPEEAAAQLLAWLEPKPGQKPCRWLMVLDDVADPADLRGLWPPNSPNGRTVVTTRRRDAALTATGRQLVNVGLFTRDEATAYLTTALTAHGHRVEPIGQIRGLAGDLGYLPLALSQAAAYLADTAMACARYRQLLADRIKSLAQLLPEPGDLPDDQSHTVAATWSLSIERADRMRPAGLARPMLQLTALLDANGIPYEVLTSSPALAHLDAQRVTDEQSPSPVMAEDAVGALRALHRLSLIDHSPSTPHQAVRVHQLIQRATRDDVRPGQRDVLARTAADSLTAVWPAREDGTVFAQTLRANAEVLIRHATGALFQPKAHDVLYLLGRSLGESGQTSAARDHYQYLTVEAESLLGLDHPYTLTTRHNLACWRGEAGDPAGAAAALENLLEHTLWVLGPSHPNTLATWHNLARWRGETGDAAGAVTALERVLADRERVLGPDHRDTLTTWHNLACWHGEAGDPTGAVTALEKVLEEVLRVLGPRDPETYRTYNSLAYWRGEVKDTARVIAALETVLANPEPIPDLDHSDILSIVQHNLARWRKHVGDTGQVAAALGQLRSDLGRGLGPDQPDALRTQHNLAYWRGEAGDSVGAVTILEQVLAGRRRVLGPDHPDTLRTQRNLVCWQRKVAGEATAIEQVRASPPHHQT